MSQTIKVQNLDKNFYKNIWLKIVANVIEDDSESQYVDDHLFTDPYRYAEHYLKATGQYRTQFQLCLKTFDGQKSSTFDEEFTSAIAEIYKQYNSELSRDFKSFSDDVLNKIKSLNIEFTGEEEADPFVTEVISRKYFASNEESDGSNRMIPIQNVSRSNIGKLEGKLRKIGQYGCIDKALRFIKLRIGLYKEYKYKVLVDDLDELFNDFLILSGTAKLKAKADKSTEELVKEAMKRYEVVNNPKYLIDQNAFQSALAKKFNSRLGRYK